MRSVTCCASCPRKATSTRSCVTRSDSWRRRGDCVREEVLVASALPTEEPEEVGLRPKRLAEFDGQPEVREHLEILLGAARKRGEPVDHTLFAGPPGLGKTTLAGIVANEMEVGFRITSGPALERAGDLAALLTNLDDGDVLFIDEIHRLGRTVEEVLYPAMEDFQLDIVIGKGPPARSIRLDVREFTLVGGAAGGRRRMAGAPMFAPGRAEFPLARRHHRDGSHPRAPARPLGIRLPPRF